MIVEKNPVIVGHALASVESIGHNPPVGSPELE